MEGREETWSQLTFQSTRKRSDFGWKTAKKASTGRKENMTGRIIPYTSVFIDACLKDFSFAARQCLYTHNVQDLSSQLQHLWTTIANPNPVLPLLSVRTGFDMFFRVMNFSPGSEVIMSAVNIPDMVRIVQFHKLRIVPLDITIDTTAPKIELLEQLVSSRTVAIVIAHIYGKWAPMDDVIRFANERNLYVIEDCAESFCGFDRLSHPQTDLALFSFGVIKFYTSFGGAIAKVRDEEIYRKMVALHETYRVQSQALYLQKLMKYVLVYFALDVACINKNGIRLLNIIGVDYKHHAIKMLRGFPSDLIAGIRVQPCGALLATMLYRQKSFSEIEFCMQQIKADYIAARLPPLLEVVGHKAAVNNYWLFPVLTENPDNMMSILGALGVDAYRGATQLNIVEPHNGEPEPLMDPVTNSGSSDCDTDKHNNARPTNEINDCKESSVTHCMPRVNPQYPHEAKYLIDHVLYLPVNKLVPFHELNRMLQVIRLAVAWDSLQAGGKLRKSFPSKL